MTVASHLSAPLILAPDLAGVRVTPAYTFAVPGAELGVAAAPRQGSLRRSVELFRAFRVEQTDPDRFYRRLAADSVQQLSEYAALDGRTVLDVGGGPGYFEDAFREAGASYLALDSNVGELSLHGRVPSRRTFLGSGVALPVRSQSVDVCYSSNVLEHVSEPERMAEEMLRVTRPGGIVFLSYTVWLGPWGGHETAPWHYLGGRYAARHYRRRHGVAPKNDFGSSLFALSVSRMVRWARCEEATHQLTVVDILPRYHPAWARWVVRVPIARELMTWNLVLVLRPR
jgi:SAM-dependent methyltransferase